jgi:hypothetical protein
MTLELGRSARKNHRMPNAIGRVAARREVANAVHSAARDEELPDEDAASKTVVNGDQSVSAPQMDRRHEHQRVVQQHVRLRDQVRPARSARAELVESDIPINRMPVHSTKAGSVGAQRRQEFTGREQCAKRKVALEQRGVANRIGADHHALLFREHRGSGRESSRDATCAARPRLEYISTAST